MNRQAIFDEIVEHIRRQRAPARGAYSCVYLNDAGRSCGIGGPLVARGLWHKSFNHMGVAAHTLHDGPEQDEVENAMNLAFALVELGVEDIEDLRFLQRMQSCHDTVSGASSSREFVDGFLVKADAAALAWGLDPKAARIRSAA